MKERTFLSGSGMIGQKTAWKSWRAGYGYSMFVRSLFVDLNSYFASCEQQMRPELRGRPVAVVPMMADSTSCIAASYEAKAFGVKTGTMVRDAKRMCPGIVLVEGRHELYIKMHHEVIAAVDSVVPVRKVWSIDEMECRLLGVEREPARAIELAKRVKAAIREQVGEVMKCSVGLAPNRILAKVATDMQKPDGLVIIRQDELPGRLIEAGLVLRDLPGVGPQMEKRLNSHQIWTIADMLAQSEAKLAEIWGSVVGRYWYQWLRGHETDEHATRTKSIGHEHVLPPESRNETDARAILIRLLHKAAARLRQNGLQTGRLDVFVRIMGAEHGPGRWGVSGKPKQPGAEHGEEWGGAEIGGVIEPRTEDTLALVRVFAELWEAAVAEIGKRGAWKPLKVGVVLSDVEPVVGSTLPLFAPPRPTPRLGGVMDTINRKFGKGAIYSGAMHVAKESAPVRIAFHSVPDLDVPA